MRGLIAGLFIMGLLVSNSVYAMSDEEGKIKQYALTVLHSDSTALCTINRANISKLTQELTFSISNEKYREGTRVLSKAAIDKLKYLSCVVDTDNAWAGELDLNLSFEFE